MNYPEQLKVLVYLEHTDKYDIWVAQCLDFDIAAHGDLPQDALYEFERLYVAQIAAALDSGIAPLESVPKAPDFFWDMYYKKAKLEVKPIDHEIRFKLLNKVPANARSIMDTRHSTRLIGVATAA